MSGKKAGGVNTEEVRVFMLRHRLTVRAISRAANVKEPNVSAAINNRKRHLGVLNTLANLGCPYKFLGLQKNVEVVA